MATVLQFVKDFDGSPQVMSNKRVTVRRSNGEADIAAWLALRDRTFARERMGVRKWSYDDYVREFFHKWWWRPDWQWIAESEQSPGQILGSVTMALRGQHGVERPAIHWLMVDPAHRRRGIARMLVSYLEAAAWDAGYRQICLETHAAWQAAARFYEALGYVRSPAG